MAGTQNTGNIGGRPQPARMSLGNEVDDSGDQRNVDNDEDEEIFVGRGENDDAESEGSDDEVDIDGVNNRYEWVKRTIHDKVPLKLATCILSLKVEKMLDL